MVVVGQNQKPARVSELAANAGRQIVAGEKNFIKKNLNKAVFEMKPPPLLEREEMDAKKLNPAYGKVPSYLNRLKEQKDEKEKFKQEQEELMKQPPGTKLLPEHERLETLRELGQARIETLQQMEKVTCQLASSPTMDRHKRELEERMKRIEKGID